MGIKILYDKGGGGGGSKSANIPHALYVCGIVQDEEHIWSYQTNSEYHFCPYIKGGNGYPDFFSEGKPFKIHMKVKPTSLKPYAQRDSTNSLFGSTYNYYDFPSCDFYLNAIGLGINKKYAWDGWYDVSGFLLENGKVYIIELGWTGEKVFINIYNEDSTLVIEKEWDRTTGYFPRRNGEDRKYFCFGGLQRSGNHDLRGCEIDITDTYVEVNDELIWGNKK